MKRPVLSTAAAVFGVAVVFSLFVFGDLGAAATTYYVSTSGNDSNAGTQSAPFRTLNKGVSVLKPGDTLRVVAGTYAETLLNSIPSGTSWSAPVTVIADDPSNRPIIRPNGSGGEGVVTFEGNLHYIELNGFVIDAVNVSTNAVKISYSGGNTADHIRLKNCEVKNVLTGLNQGILIGPGQTGTDGGFNEVIACDIHNNGINDNLSQGIYVDTPNNLIDGNTIHDNVNNGITVYNGYAGQAAGNNVIRNNRVYNNGTGAMGFGTGITVGCGDNNLVYNNLVYGNNAAGAGGIYVSSFGAPTSPTNTKIYNNTVYANAGQGVLVAGDSSSAAVRNNILYSNGTDYVDSGSGTAADHNLVGINPGFTNASSGDFSLQSTSSAIDAGVTLTVVPTDIKGTTRPQGAACDIGAYERATTAGTPPSSPANVRIIG